MAKRDNNPFRIEEYRDKLARKGSLKKLEKTYSRDYPEIDNENTSELWDNLNSRPHLTRSEDPMGYDRLNTVVKLIKDREVGDLKVLNVGCGAGDLEYYLFKNLSSIDLEWHGIDISPLTIEEINKEFPSGNFEVGKIEKLEFKKESFDYVIALEVLEHVPPRNTIRSLQEVKRVLKKDGRFIVSVPINEGLEEMVEIGENPNAHVRVYTPELIKSELAIVGLKVIYQKQLYAFNDFYVIKSMVAKLIKGFRRPNNIILLAQKQ